MMRPAFYERLLRRLLPPLFRALDEQQARQDRQRDELDADRGQAEQTRRQLREALSALEDQDRAGYEALNKAAESAREEARIRAEALAEGLHRAHQRQDEQQNRLAALEADGERRSARFAAALGDLRAEHAALLGNQSDAQTAALAALRGEQTAALREAGEESRRQLGTLGHDVENRIAALAAGLSADAEARSAALSRTQSLQLEEFQRAETARQEVTESLRAELAVLHGENKDRLTALSEAAQQTAALTARLHALENPADGLDYAAFEARFRGSEEMIRERQTVYLPLLQNHQPIADLGCGRGELVALLQANGLEIIGVENNDGQLAACQAKGLPVENADLLAWLRARPPESLGAIVCLQVIEHLSLADQRRLLELARQALKPGGLLLFETVNPHCPEGLEWFYIDPTHKRPVYPEMLDFLMGLAGFRDLTLRFQISCTSAPPGQPLTAATGADFALWGFRP